MKFYLRVCLFKCEKSILYTWHSVSKMSAPAMHKNIADLLTYAKKIRIIEERTQIIKCVWFVYENKYVF